MSEPTEVFEDPADPGYVYMSRCILCGIAAAEHTEEACQAKLAASLGPQGILGMLGHEEWRP